MANNLQQLCYLNTDIFEHTEFIIYLYKAEKGHQHTY